jgi:hypothetical protein
MMAGLKAAGVLRLSAERERQGMDVAEHGGPAYPENVPRTAADPRRDLMTSDAELRSVAR